MPSTFSEASTEVGWTGIYVGLLVAAASTIFVRGPPTQGCYPGCVGPIDETLAIAGLMVLLVGLALAAVGSQLAEQGEDGSS